MLTSRERVQMALEHRQPDRVPVDLGGVTVTGMHASTVYRLRQALHLDPPGTPVKVIEPFQFLGEIKPDMVELLGLDVVPVAPLQTIFGFRSEGWRPWTLFDGTPLLVPQCFNTEPDANGDILMYPAGDRSAQPSGRMPSGGFYFDAIVRQPPLDEARLDPEDNMEEFLLLTDEELAHFKAQAERQFHETDRAVFANFGGTSFGDIALVPAMWLKDPKGIRDIAEWYISTLTRPEYIYRVFERQCEIGLQNLAKAYAAVRDHVHIVCISGTDFGGQRGLITSPRTYRQLYKPFHKTLNDWIHTHTPWKTFLHSCGSIAELLPDFIGAGFDILNPVQTSAAGMDPRRLKEQFGDQVVFWGGGVDTQRTLPFGTPDEVRAEVRERIRVFGRGGGFVFNPVHNVQAHVPVENLLAMFEAVRECGGLTEPMA